MIKIGIIIAIVATVIAAGGGSYLYNQHTAERQSGLESEQPVDREAAQGLADRFIELFSGADAIYAAPNDFVSNTDLDLAWAVRAVLLDPNNFAINLSDEEKCEVTKWSYGTDANQPGFDCLLLFDETEFISGAKVRERIKHIFGEDAYPLDFNALDEFWYNEKYDVFFNNVFGAVPTYNGFIVDEAVKRDGLYYVTGVWYAYHHGETLEQYDDFENDTWYRPVVNRDKMPTTEERMAWFKAVMAGSEVEHPAEPPIYESFDCLMQNSFDFNRFQLILEGLGERVVVRGIREIR